MKGFELKCNLQHQPARVVCVAACPWDVVMCPDLVPYDMYKFVKFACCACLMLIGWQWIIPNSNRGQLFIRCTFQDDLESIKDVMVLFPLTALKES